MQNNGKPSELRRVSVDSTESQTVRRAQQGRQEDRTTLYETYYLRVYRFITGMCRSADQAEDLTQDVFVKVLLTEINNFRFESTFYTWVFSVAKNTTLNAMRQHADDNPLTDEVLDLADNLDHARTIESAHDLNHLQDAILLLPEQYRVAILLHDIDALSYEDIGLIMDLSRDRVRKLVHDARERLRGLVMKGGRS